jgi:hypothetical protein
MAPKVENKQGRLKLSESIVSLKLQLCRWFEHEFVDMNKYENRQITAPMRSQFIIYESARARCHDRATVFLWFPIVRPW